MEEIEKTMPDRMHWEFAYDTTRFVNASMKEIVATLLLTFVLVVIITWLFLQSWRATIIPAVAIPVSLIGTFLFMHVIGMVIMELEDWSKRRGLGLDIKSIQDQAMAVGSQFPDAQVLALVPPPIQGLGDSGGVTFALQAVAGQSFRELSEAAHRLVRRIMQSGKAMYAFTSFDCSTPMVEFKLDRAKAEAMGVPVSDVFNTLQAQLGSFYVNDFNKFGKTYQVKIQAKKEGRATMASINSIYVTGRNGAQIPISALGTFEWTLGSRQAERFNMFSSGAFTCQGLPGVSSGEKGIKDFWTFRSLRSPLND